MSAPPQNMPNGQKKPNGPQAPNAVRGAPPIRRPARANPLVTRKRPDPSKMMNRPASTQKPPGSDNAKSQAQISESLRQKEKARLANFAAQREQNKGWTDPLPDGAREFSLKISKQPLKEGKRFHIMRFSKAKGGALDRGVDPTNPDEFTRPVTLHRRDPRQPPPGREVKEEVVEAPPPPTVDEKEAEHLAQLKAEKEAQRAADLAQVAPDAPKPGVEVAATKKPGQKKEKVFNAHFKTSKDNIKASELRYEEALPWHLEDADGKNVWVGSYVAPLSEANVGLFISEGGFKIIPLEKYYRFISKPPFKAFSIEEAEARMKQKVEIGRWAMRAEEKQKDRQELEATRMIFGGPTRVKKESATYRAAPRSEKLDHDELDMSGDEFQDDDENPGMEPENDEDARESRDRQRRNHLGANLFGEADEKEVEKQEQEEELLELLRKSEGKKVRKALARREKHLEYQSDSEDENPYADSSSEEEELSESEKKEQEAKEKEKEKEKDAKDKLAPGAAAKGNLSPSSKQKAAENAKAGKSLKRPGSPNLSESSGNESSRKKKVKKQATGSVQPSRSGTPLPGQQQAAKGRGPGGFTSDGEATGGEMSDAGRKKKKKKAANLGAGGPSGANRGTPVGSRAGSPVPSQGAPASGSNPGSPAKTGPASPGPGSPLSPVTADEIIAVLEANSAGITIGELLKHFSKRVGDGEGMMIKKDWIRLVMNNSHFDKAEKLLRPKAK